MEYTTKKNNLESKIYDLKNLIQKKNLGNNVYEGKNILQYLQDIEDQINDSYNKIIDLSSYEDNLNKIVLSITPNNVITEKGKLLYDINTSQKMLNEGKIKLSQKEINNANNMLEYFKKQLCLVIDLNEIQNLKNEYNAEKKKYF